MFTKFAQAPSLLTFEQSFRVFKLKTIQRVIFNKFVQMNPDPQKMNANKQPCLSPSFLRPQTSKQKPKNYERQKL